MNPPTDDRLGYHIVRRVSRPESPFAGVLARDDAGTTALLAEVGAPGAWPTSGVWRGAHGAGEHVLAPLDVLATTRGHEMVLPWCTETVAEFLARRRRAEHPLSAGEAVTLGVCVLRGMRELALPADGGEAPVRELAQSEHSAGEWWLTGDARPMFVQQPGDPATGRNSHAATLDAVAAACRDRGIEALLRRTSTGVAEAEAAGDRYGAPGAWASAFGRVLDAGEDALFEASSPAPLEVRSLRPRVSRSLGAEFDEHLRGNDPALGTDAARVLTPARGWASAGGRRAGAKARRFALEQVRDATARHVDPEIADAAIDAWQGARDAVSRVLRRPMMVGLILAVLVVGVGVLWPTGAEQETAARSSSEGPAPGEAGPAPTATPSQSAGPPATPEPGEGAANPAADSDPDGGQSEGLPGVANALLKSRILCAGDEACLGKVYEDADAAARFGAPESAPAPARPIDADQRERTTMLIDDLGGVVVLRVERVAGEALSSGAPVPSRAPVTGDAPLVDAEMLIIVQTERGWRLRDVFDVLEAPPTGGS